MSYLARLALRALGRPVHARLVPRVDSPPQAAADGAWADAGSSVLRSAPALPPDAARGARHEPPAVTDAARAASRARAAGHHTGRAPMEQTPEQDGRARDAHLSAADALMTGASARGGAGPRSPAPAHSTAPAQVARSAAPAPFDPGALNAAQAASSTRSRPVTPRRSLPSPRHPGAQPARAAPSSEASERSAGDPAATPTWAAAIARPATGDDVRAALLRQSETLRDAPAEPAAVNVEIGRIEVRIAPPPAPDSRPRAAPEGFERYWRLRNYLDRSG